MVNKFFEMKHCYFIYHEKLIKFYETKNYGSYFKVNFNVESTYDSYLFQLVKN